MPVTATKMVALPVSFSKSNVSTNPGARASQPVGIGFQPVSFADRQTPGSGVERRFYVRDLLDRMQKL
jgi:hypothetical protein